MKSEQPAVRNHRINTTLPIPGRLLRQSHFTLQVGLAEGVTRHRTEALYALRYQEAATALSRADMVSPLASSS